MDAESICQTCRGSDLRDMHLLCDQLSHVTCCSAYGAVIVIIIQLHTGIFIIMARTADFGGIAILHTKTIGSSFRYAHVVLYNIQNCFHSGFPPYFFVLSVVNTIVSTRFKNYYDCFVRLSLCVIFFLLLTVDLLTRKINT